MEFNGCIEGCKPPQLINFNWAFNIEEVNKITILNENNCPYDKSVIEYAYSVDNNCWSCFMTEAELLTNVLGINQDVYLRVKIAGAVSSVKIDEEPFEDYTVSLVPGFDFKLGKPIPQKWNPYANLDCLMGLNQYLTSVINNTFGIPIYYFKLAPNVGSKDLTFKEYALMDVEAVKQIKLIVQDGQMPSSRPEFAEFGLEWQTDWETDISKVDFATAFGPTAQPMEGDLIYIPLMKRMWMVNEAYEEKKDALMWNATTFKVALVKYQEKESVNLGDTESLVNSFVKNKYDDLFGEEETLDSGFESVEAPTHIPSNLYPVFESDATRKYMSVESINISDKSTYFKGTLISDSLYTFNEEEASLIYQKKYCGENGTCSFVITPESINFENIIIKIGSIHIGLEQDKQVTSLKLLNNLKNTITLYAGKTYFVYLRWSKQLNCIEFSAAQYAHADLPLYKLQPQHYWFDVDNLSAKTVSKYNIEMVQDTKQQVEICNFCGTLTNFKLFDTYNDNVSEILQMYPTHQHLLINDTARKILTIDGVQLN